MLYKHICAHHARLISLDNALARKYWTMFIKRGRTAFSDCRWEGAVVYLGAAIDVAALRLAVPSEKEFNLAHILEPLDMLCKIYALEQRPELGEEKISYVKEKLLAIADPVFIEKTLSKLSASLLDEKHIGRDKENISTVGLVH